MNQPAENPTPFQVKDCALIALATGTQVNNLRELKEGLKHCPDGVIYHLFWGGRLRPGFEGPEYFNDLAHWVRHSLHDQRSAEKLALIDPTACTATDELRVGVLDVLDECLYEKDHIVSCEPGRHLDFTTSQIVVFETGRTVSETGLLSVVVEQMSLSSIFYHFIDARRRTDGGTDDFTAWLAETSADSAPAVSRLADVDPYFCSLAQLQVRIVEALSFLAGGVV